MPSGRLASFWTYDKETAAIPIARAPLPKTASVGCEVNTDVTTELEREKERTKALATENRRLRELVGFLESKIRSLEHGGGTPQPAPPDAGVQGSGGGVAAGALSSAQASPMHISMSLGPVALDCEKTGGGGGGARTPQEPQQNQTGDWVKNRRDGKVPSSPPRAPLGENSPQQKAPSIPSGASLVDDNGPDFSALARPCPSLTSPNCGSHDVEEMLAQRVSDVSSSDMGSIALGIIDGTWKSDRSTERRGGPSKEQQQPSESPGVSHAQSPATQTEQAGLTSRVEAANDADILDEFISSTALAAREGGVADVVGSGDPALEAFLSVCDQRSRDASLPPSSAPLLETQTLGAVPDETSLGDPASAPTIDAETTVDIPTADATCTSRSDSEQLLDAAADAAAAVAASSSNSRSITRTRGSGSSRESQKIRQEKRRKTIEDRKERREREREETSRSTELTIRHIHVLECFICGQRPQDGDRCKVVFCANCPRKACISCQEEDGIQRDRAGWTGGQDEYGAYFVNPLCGRCLQSADDEIPTSEQALGFTLGVMEITREEVSDGEMRSLLLRFLDWLENHDLAHFFVDEVDPEEYPEYREVVKHPMNFKRMRSRLTAGEYDDRRGGIMRLMEDVDWIRHNCTIFNGEEQAISRCARILERRAKLYSEELITPLTTKLRRPGTEIPPRITGAENRKRRFHIAELIEVDRESEGEGSVNSRTGSTCGVSRSRRKSARGDGLRDVDIAEDESDTSRGCKRSLTATSDRGATDAKASGTTDEESSGMSVEDNMLHKRPRRSACAKAMSEESLSRSGFRFGGSLSGNACVTTDRSGDVEPPDADQTVPIDDDDQDSSMSIDEEGISDQDAMKYITCNESKIDTRECDTGDDDRSADAGHEVGKSGSEDPNSGEVEDCPVEMEANALSPSRRGNTSTKDASNSAGHDSLSMPSTISLE